MLRQWVVWLTLCTTLAHVDESPYCGLRYERLCTGKGPHVACQFPYRGPGEACENYTNIIFSNELKQFILHYINRRRQKIASGHERVRGGIQLPKPEIMMMVHWDRELAFLAQRLADQCQFVHDDCRATVRYPYAGQTVGEVRWRTSGPLDQGARRVIGRVFDAWWGERRRVQVKQLTAPFVLTARGAVWGHFSQLAVWTLRAMGCGAVHHGSTRPRLLLVCDFSHTNMLGQQTISPGPLADCPQHTFRLHQSPYPLLCTQVLNKEPAAYGRRDDMYEEEEDEDDDKNDDDDVGLNGKKEPFHKTPRPWHNRKVEPFHDTNLAIDNREDFVENDPNHKHKYGEIINRDRQRYSDTEDENRQRQIVNNRPKDKQVYSDNEDENRQRQRVNNRPIQEPIDINYQHGADDSIFRKQFIRPIIEDNIYERKRPLVYEENNQDRRPVRPIDDENVPKELVKPVVDRKHYNKFASRPLEELLSESRMSVIPLDRIRDKLIRPLKPLAKDVVEDVYEINPSKMEDRPVVWRQYTVDKGSDRYRDESAVTSVNYRDTQDTANIEELARKMAPISINRESDVRNKALQKIDAHRNWQIRNKAIYKANQELRMGHLILDRWRDVPEEEKRIKSPDITTIVVYKPTSIFSIATEPIVRSRYMQTRYRPSRPGAQALLTSPVILLRRQSQKVNVFSASLWLDKDDEEQLFHDTGFKLSAKNGVFQQPA